VRRDPKVTADCGTMLTVAGAVDCHEFCCRINILSENYSRHGAVPVLGSNILKGEELPMDYAALMSALEVDRQALDRLVLNSDEPSADVVLDVARAAKQVSAMITALQRAC
jgi:hypothetical protein